MPFYTYWSILYLHIKPDLSPRQHGNNSAKDEYWDYFDEWKWFKLVKYLSLIIMSMPSWWLFQIDVNDKYAVCYYLNPLQWRHDKYDGVSNHQPHDCLLNRLFRRRSKKISNLRLTGLCAGLSPITGEFPAQRPSNAENVSIWWRPHERWPSSATLMCVTWPQWDNTWDVSLNCQSLNCKKSSLRRR